VGRGGVDMRRAVFLGLIAALFLSPHLPSTASAADVSVTLQMQSFQFHIDGQTSPPTMTATANDTLRLRIENLDSVPHTFTVPHFSIDESLVGGAIVFVNITTDFGDVGRWQFWCSPHSGGTDPENHSGMIGWIEIQSTSGPPPPPPKPLPGFEALAAIGALAAAFVIVGLRRRQ